MFCSLVISFVISPDQVVVSGFVVVDVAAVVVLDFKYCHGVIALVFIQSTIFF
ncbi:MAG: hypothetical protein WCG25_09925 [bacterium]